MHHKYHFKLHLIQFIYLILVGIVIILLFRSGIFNLTTIINLIKGHFFFGLIIYFLFIIIATIIVPVPSVPLWPLAIYFYGFWIAFIITAVGTLIGGIITFAVAKKFGTPIVLKMIGKKLYEEIDHLVNIENTKMFLLIRIFGNNYFDTISYVAGLSKLSLKSYILVTVPTSAAWVLAQMLVIEKLGGIENIKSFIAVMAFYGTIILVGTLMWEAYHKHHLAKALN